MKQKKNSLHSLNDYPCPEREILTSSKLKEVADNSFKFDENGRKFSKGLKTLWEKNKLLVTSDFFVFPSVSTDLSRRHVTSRACLGKS